MPDLTIEQAALLRRLAHEMPDLTADELAELVRRHTSEHRAKSTPPKLSLLPAAEFASVKMWLLDGTGDLSIEPVLRVFVAALLADDQAAVWQSGLQILKNAMSVIAHVVPEERAKQAQLAKQAAEVDSGSPAQ